MLRRIVFGYTVDCFPSQLILGHNQFKRMLDRAGYDVAVNLCRLDDLPPDTDILLVPTELAEEAKRAAHRCQLDVGENFLSHPLYEALVQELEEGKEWTAARPAENARNDEEGQVMHYRGYERIE